MSEHFNIVGWLGKRANANHKRSLLEFAFREFKDVLGRPVEIVMIDANDGVESQEEWDVDSALLGRSLTANELLFVYGEVEGQRSGDRASVCFEEASSRGTVALSLPKQNIVGYARNVDDICLRLFSELSTQFSRSLVVAGWEIELPASISALRNVIETVRAQPAIEALVVPAEKTFEIPGFQREEKNGVSVFRRTTSTIGH